MRFQEDKKKIEENNVSQLFLDYFIFQICLTFSL